jgi:hypothetical protein
MDLGDIFMRLLIECPRSLSIAFSTNAAALSVDVGVGLVIWMSLWAVRFIAVPRATLPIVLAAMVGTLTDSAHPATTGPQAYSFGGVFVAARAVAAISPIVPAPSQVFFVGNWFEMCGIYATRRFAAVVKLQSVSNWTDQLFIYNSVGRARFVVPSARCVAPRSRTNPVPALIWFSHRNMFGKQFFHCHLLERGV